VTELTPAVTPGDGPGENDAVESLIERYFAMWNSGDTSAASDVLSPAWTDYNHPEVTTPEQVAESVTRIRAARPALRFELDSITGHVAVGRAGESLLAWVFTSDGTHLTSVRTYRAM
jgi:hypothetical protein